jgi:tetratricopeptide (TPR) repeat protein
VDVAEALIQNADDAYQRGNALFQRGQKEKARAAYERAVRLFPKHVYAWSNLGTVRRELGDLQGSLAAHQQVEREGGREGRKEGGRGSGGLLFNGNTSKRISHSHDFILTISFS